MCRRDSGVGVASVGRGGLWVGGTMCVFVSGWVGHWSRHC